MTILDPPPLLPPVPFFTAAGLGVAIEIAIIIATLGQPMWRRAALSLGVPLAAFILIGWAPLILFGLMLGMA